MKILIVDDEACIVELFSRLAHAQGHEEIDTAGSAEEALACAARDKTYDLITLDCHMPGANGLEVVALLRIANPHAVIALISGCLPCDIDSAVVGCIDTMISKPISVGSFVQLLQSAAQRSESQEDRSPGSLGQVSVYSR